MEYKFSDVFSWESGKPVIQTNGSVPVYGSNGIIGFTDIPKYKNKIILGRVGVYCGSVEYCKTDFNATDNTLVTTCDTSKILYGYAFYLLKQYKLNEYSGGSAQPLITQGLLKHLKCNLPSLEFQEKIISVLDKYEKIIENNNIRIKVLEQMAENLYKEWFVRFRFPSHETAEFENGIPKGWDIKRLSDIANVVMGQSPPSEYYNVENIGLPFHQGVGSYGDIYLDDSIYSTEGKRVAEPNSIIFSVRAPVGRINITLNRIVLGRGVASINSKANRNAFLYWQLKSTFATEDVIGNGAIFASVTKDELLRQRMLVPDIDTQILFDSFAKKIEKQIRCYYLSNKNLIKQRDLLLPRLMSGKLEV